MLKTVLTFQFMLDQLWLQSRSKRPTQTSRWGGSGRSGLAGLVGREETGQSGFSPADCLGKTSLMKREATGAKWASFAERRWSVPNKVSQSLVESRWPGWGPDRLGSCWAERSPWLMFARDRSTVPSKGGTAAPKGTRASIPLIWGH